MLFSSGVLLTPTNERPSSPEHVRRRLVHSTGFKEVQSLGIYLGVPLTVEL